MKIKLSHVAITLALSCTSVISFASNNVPQPGDVFSYKDISPEIYFESAENKAQDPANAVLEQMRERRKIDLANPEAPQPFKGMDVIQPEFQSSAVPWQDFRDVFNADWQAMSSASPQAVADLGKTVKVKTVMDHPDFKIIEMAIGPGGTLPRFADSAPGSFHVLEGAAKITVDDRTVEAYTGTSVKLESLSQRRIEVTSDAPLKVLWFRWAPNGQQEYLSYGYYLTGCNFHAQPIEAIMPKNFEQWDESVRQRFEELKHKAINEPEKDSVYAKQLHELIHQQEAHQTTMSRYPQTPMFSNEKDVKWLDFTNMGSSGFFWAKDASKGGAVLEAWNSVARMKGVFQAKVPDEQYDFNISYLSTGPRSKYVTHSHATPEFYYILGGKTEWLVNGTTYEAVPGNVYFHSPYWDHEMRGLKEGAPQVAITGSWAPFGDRSVFEQPMLFTETLHKQPKTAFIGKDFNFHDFKIKQGLKFQSL